MYYNVACGILGLLIDELLFPVLLAIDPILPLLSIPSGLNVPVSLPLYRFFLSLLS